MTPTVGASFCLLPGFSKKITELDSGSTVLLTFFNGQIGGKSMLTLKDILRCARKFGVADEGSCFGVIDPSRLRRGFKGRKKVKTEEGGETVEEKGNIPSEPVKDHK